MELSWKILGWIGLGFFFGRFLVQWWASERAGTSVAPRAFWGLSLAGAGLLAGYSLHRAEPVFLAGYVVTSFIYTRNLWLSRPGRGNRSLGPLPTTALALLAWGVMLGVGADSLRPAVGGSLGWLVVGALGQAIWSSRFVAQWYASERVGASHFPEVFWWISLVGNALLLAYAIRVGDPIWIAGLCAGPVVQVRNLVLLHRARPESAAAPGAAPRREIA